MKPGMKRGGGVKRRRTLRGAAVGAILNAIGAPQNFQQRALLSNPAVANIMLNRMQQISNTTPSGKAISPALVQALQRQAASPVAVANYIRRVKNDENRKALATELVKATSPDARLAVMNPKEKLIQRMIIRRAAELKAGASPRRDEIKETPRKSFAAAAKAGDLKRPTAAKGGMMIVKKLQPKFIYFS